MTQHHDNFVKMLCEDPTFRSRYVLGKWQEEKLMIQVKTREQVFRFDAIEMSQVESGILMGRQPAGSVVELRTSAIHTIQLLPRPEAGTIGVAVSVRDLKCGAATESAPRVRCDSCGR